MLLSLAENFSVHRYEFFVALPAEEAKFWRASAK